MAKSKGNFMTLRDGVRRFTADGLRLGRADAGDGLDDANFVGSFADTALLKLHAVLKWMEVLDVPSGRSDNTRASRRRWKVWTSSWLANRPCSTTACLLAGSTRPSFSLGPLTRSAWSLHTTHNDRSLYRDVVRRGLFDLQNALGMYLTVVESLGAKPNRQLILRCVSVIPPPVIPPSDPCSFIEVQVLLLSPITPHTSEFVWNALLKQVI